jgi:hypothetical protein
MPLRPRELHSGTLTAGRYSRTVGAPLKGTRLGLARYWTKRDAN